MSGKQFKVLLIEDNPVDARMIEPLLSQAGNVHFLTERAPRLSIGMDRLSHDSFDVVLLDLTLPDSSGLETFDRLYHFTPDVPIVVLSGVDDEDTAIRAVQQGAQDYLVKGFEPQLLPRSLIYAIERFRASEELRKREEHLRLLTDQLPCVFWTTNHRLEFTSSRGADLDGLDLLPDEVVGRSVRDYFQTGGSSLAIAAHVKALEGESQTFNMRWKDRTYHVHVEPFYERSGHVIGTIGVALDITDQVHAKVALELTRHVQRGLFPHRTPSLPWFEIAGVCYPSQEAGGDFYDYYESHTDGSVGIAVGDVSGHGLGPAMLMALVHAYLRAMTQTHTDPGQILTMVNRLLAADSEEQRLVSLFYAWLHKDEPVVQYSAAGHQAHWLRYQGQQQLLTAPGIPLNIHTDQVFTSSEPLRLAPGDLLLMYTDGIVECTNSVGQQFGVDRMLQVAESVRDRSPSIIVQNIIQQVRDFAHADTQEDDMTLVIVKVRQPPNAAEEG